MKKLFSKSKSKNLVILGFIGLVIGYSIYLFANYLINKKTGSCVYGCFNAVGRQKYLQYLGVVIMYISGLISIIGLSVYLVMASKTETNKEE